MVVCDVLVLFFTTLLRAILHVAEWKGKLETSRKGDEVAYFKYYQVFDWSD
jgi:hypothetical protein